MSGMVGLLISGMAHSTGFHTLNGGTTGGQGGQIVRATTGTQIHQALCNRSSSDTPLVIEVSGTIRHENTSKVSGNSCNTASDKIQLKDIKNITLIGAGEGALFDQIGIQVRNATNIIIRNIHVRNVKKSGHPTSNGGDAIGMESNVSNVWVDHVTLEASGGESEGYDSLIDIKANVKYVTLSYSLLQNSGRGGLVGASDSDYYNGPITFHHNMYRNIDSRTPLLRYATAHSYNNYFYKINSSGMNPRVGGEIKAENNYFKDSRDVIGTFYTDKMGYWEVSGNIWDNVRWTDRKSKNYPAGPDPASNVHIKIPYNYQLDDAACLPDLLDELSGAGKGMKTSNGRCEPDNGNDDPSVINHIINGTYRITPVHSDKTLDITNCQTGNGANVQQWSWLDNSCQKFRITPVDGIWHRISPENSPGKALDIAHRATNAGANVQLYQYWGGANQQYRFQAAGYGKWRIISRNSGLCLDVSGKRVHDGANIIQWTCNPGASNQMFSLTRQ